MKLSFVAVISAIKLAPSIGRYSNLLTISLVLYIL